MKCEGVKVLTMGGVRPGAIVEDPDNGDHGLEDEASGGSLLGAAIGVDERS